MPGDEHMASVYFDALLYELRKCQQMASDTVAERIRQMIITSDRMLTNGEVAARLQIGIKTVEQAFRKCFGQTIRQYQIETKIKNAKFYLINFPEMRLNEIAENLGFYNEFHFSKQFKRQVGISPRRYRRKGSDDPTVE